MHGIFDSHAHYDDKSFDGDREETIARIHSAGVCGILNIGCSVESSKKSIALAEKFPFIYAAVGLHPDQADNPPAEWLAEIRKLSYAGKVVAIGEIGLDYHYDTPARKAQADLFEQQLALAKECSLPVVIHSRDAAEDTLRLLQKYRPQGVMHCFSGSVETAEEILSLGMYIGFTGVVTFQNARKAKEVAAMVPMDRLLLETDCPYMAPVPFRGKRTTSDMIAYTAEAIGRQKGVSAQEVIDAARNNTQRLFSIYPDGKALC